MYVSASRAALGLLAVMFLNGCVSPRLVANTKGKPVRQGSVPAITSAQPVSLRNASTQQGVTELGARFSWKAFGDLHAITASAVETLQLELARQQVPLAENGPKSFSLAVTSVKVEQGMAKWRASVTLKLTTGGGLEKTYDGWQNYMTLYASTSAIELSLVHCVEQMLNDPEILAYLKQ